MMQGWAQEKEKEETLEDILSKVSIDTIQIKATPYEKVLVNGVWKDEDKQTSEQIMDLLLADIQGQPIFKTSMQLSKAELNFINLKEGQYKLIVYTPEKPIFSIINISR
jgi:hypothetical protein